MTSAILALICLALAYKVTDFSKNTSQRPTIIKTGRRKNDVGIPSWDKDLLDEINL